jgi:hypothetical protein
MMEIVVALFFLLFTMISVSEVIQKTIHREWWKFPRSSHMWRVIHKDVWNFDSEVRDGLWFQEYRMTYTSFLNLVEFLRPYVEHETTNYRAAIEVDRAIAMVLNKLAFGFSNRHVANNYCVGQSTVWKYTFIVTEALANPKKLYSHFISIPQGERLISIIAHFKCLTGLENMCGAIDGTHIRLAEKPPMSLIPADYWNRHDHHSILLQGVCDANLLFWDVCVRAPGGTHDATHFRDSFLYKDFLEKAILQEPSIRLGSQLVRPYIAGDSAYPLMIHIMKAYSDRGSGDMYKDAFDRAFRAGRVKIENTFAHLKNSWRVLKCLNFTVPYAGQIIVACCVLHNFCIMNNEQLARGKIEDPHLNLNDLRVPRRPTSERAIRFAGIAIRHAIYEKWLHSILND